MADSITTKSDNLFELKNGKLTVSKFTLLTDIPENVTFKPFSTVCKSSRAPGPLFRRAHSHSSKSGFLGFSRTNPSDRLTNSLGKFSGRDFLSIFRFKTWWSTQWVGISGSDIQMETQWVMLDVPEIKSYFILIPIIEKSFRSALHPGPDGHMLICAESGSTRVKASSFDSIVYVHVSDNPYNLMKEAYTALRVHLDTFRLMEEKTPPCVADRFGWCTWDAFYLTVEPAGVWRGVKEFADGGFTPRFLIIDDGWQSISFDHKDDEAENLVLGGAQVIARLDRLDECRKFQKYKLGSLVELAGRPAFDPKKLKMLISKAIEAEKTRYEAGRVGANDLSRHDAEVEILKSELEGMAEEKAEDSGMKALTRDLRENFEGLDDIYVWHALAGAWGGVRPGAIRLESKIEPCKLSPGLKGTMNDLAVVMIVGGSVGLVDPARAEDFYDSMHSYLSEVGITGVKADVINVLEYVSEDYGGRVELARAYYKGLSKSISKNFNGTGLISSMQHCNDFFFLGTEQISMGRVGDDFWFQDPNGDPMGVYWLQGVHMIHCAYNSLWMAQFIQPDWDMFQSDHKCAKFHAGSRAICGGPVYVSDSLGGHDFDLLRKLVFQDGTIPKCVHFALPTRDCLFKNPLFDSTTVLKIWNLNKYGGVVGAFNCQGAGWDPKERRIKSYSQCYKPLSVSVHVSNVEWEQKGETNKMGQAEEYAVYLTEAEKLFLATRVSDPVSITIMPSDFEIFSFVPVMKVGFVGVKFAPIGITDLFNCGGTVEGLVCDDKSVVKIVVKGGGKFLAYSSVEPKKAYVNGQVAAYNWLEEDGRLVVKVAWCEEFGGISNIVATLGISSSFYGRDIGIRFLASHNAIVRLSQDL
ncbi:stachyose synthase [Striga asiatica]|uniref:galactinol--sucrose galactosyltransferase n=1 Tax=Striga asiatica TaxID=4170 RepID=A0A5A7QC40_STRAF|nr:stachyose synthase [Striga asiatica]